MLCLIDKCGSGPPPVTTSANTLLRTGICLATAFHESKAVLHMVVRCSGHLWEPRFGHDSCITPAGETLCGNHDPTGPDTTRYARGEAPGFSCVIVCFRLFRGTPMPPIQHRRPAQSGVSPMPKPPAQSRVRPRRATRPAGSAQGP